jgi:hypothetical protein
VFFDVGQEVANGYLLIGVVAAEVDAGQRDEADPGMLRQQRAETRRIAGVGGMTARVSMGKKVVRDGRAREGRRRIACATGRPGDELA